MASLNSHDTNYNSKAINMWNAFIGSISLTGRLDLCEQRYRKMLSYKLSPTDLTYEHLVRCACVGNNIEKALSYVKQMDQEGHTPNVKCYNWMVMACLKGGYNRDEDEKQKLLSLIVEDMEKNLDTGLDLETMKERLHSKWFPIHNGR